MEDFARRAAEVFDALRQSLVQRGFSGALEEAGWRVIVDVAEREALLRGLKARYGAQEAYPILRRDDCDDVLTLVGPWLSQPGRQPVLEIHDYAEPGWERNGVWPSFDDWAAVRIGAK